jgi:aminotransferase in exopolysaccharide biosynthesis
LYGASGVIPLHAPVFAGREKEYLVDCIDSTYVSSVGPYVDRFESMMRDLTGAAHAVATVNGTAALHLALILAGVVDGDEVITQPINFVATCNAIAYQRALPVFVDVDADTLSLSPPALEEFLRSSCEVTQHGCRNRISGRRVAAIVQMHTFGLPGRSEQLAEICAKWKLHYLEDAAESIGSYVGDRHTGRYGLLGAFSFNGNKTVTSGGGGCVITNDAELGARGKHLSTTAKLPHRWEFVHDCVGFNYRLPNINAALACAQLEQLAGFLENKRTTAELYARECSRIGLAYVNERPGTRANFWLNTVVASSEPERDEILERCNASGIMVRPVWRLMNHLPAFRSAHCATLYEAERLESLVLNLPSSVRAS